MAPDGQICPLCSLVAVEGTPPPPSARSILDLWCRIYGELVCALPPDPGSFRLRILDLRRKSAYF
jgi:hypothetical protein